MKRPLFAALAFLALTACTDPAEATKAVEAMGMKVTSIDGYSFFGCSEDDWYHTEFTAVGANGKQVHGVVCSGMFFKGSTVRFQ